MNGRILILGGGLSLVLRNESLGGIEVGGTPEIQFDEACALEGLPSIGSKPSRQ